MLEKIYALPQSFHDRRASGELHATIVQDSERLDIVANAALGQILPAAVVALGLAGVALVLDPLLFAILVCAVPAMVLVKQRLGVSLRARTRVWQRAFDSFSTQTQLSLRTRTLAEVRAAEHVELERGRAHVKQLSTAGLEMAWRQGALSIAQGSILAVAAVLVLVVGGRAVALGQLSTGDLLSSYAVVALLEGQVSTVTTLLPLVISGRESLDRLDAFLDVDEPPPYRGTRPITFRSGLELRRVSFGYGDEPLLRELDLVIEPGEHVLILGPNGAGKSTLASLILGLYHPWSGELLADGISYDELDMRLLRSAFGVILQDPVLFPGTVAENIAYGRPAATSEDIEQAAETAGVAELHRSVARGLRRPRGTGGSAPLGRPAPTYCDRPRSAGRSTTPNSRRADDTPRRCHNRRVSRSARRSAAEADCHHHHPRRNARRPGGSFRASAGRPHAPEGVVADATLPGVTRAPWKPASAWPTADELLLLKAALLDGNAALDAWHEFGAANAGIDHLEGDAYRLLPQLFRSLQSLGLEEPALGRLKGIYRHAWYANQLLLRAGRSRLGCCRRLTSTPCCWKAARLWRVRSGTSAACR